MKFLQKILATLEKNELYFVVFVTGACVLIIEIAAVRILSPYFGNTIYTFSSIITTILLALSLGYFLGGRLADKSPSKLLFYQLIFASSIGVFLLLILSYLVLPSVAYYFSIISGPLITAVLLFLFPSFILGMLSPFVIKLEKDNYKKEGVGKISGNVFFASTLGSIAGSLLAGFVLIPRFGVDQIILGVGAALLSIGILGMFLAGAQKHKLKILIIAAIFASVAAGLFIKQQKIISENSVFVKDGVYEKIIIYDANLGGKPIRVMLLDRSYSGAMYLDSDDLVQTQSKYYELYKIFKPKISEALVIGGATYSIPKALISESPDIKVDVAEIEPEGYEIAKKYFRVPKSPRLTNYTADGRRFLHDTDKKYDLIFGDAYYSYYNIPAHLTTKEFFELARGRLTSEGVFIGNFIGVLDRNPPTLLFSQIKTFRQVFPNSYFFAVENPKSSEVQNFIFVGVAGEGKIDFESDEVKLSNNDLFQKLESKLIDVSSINLEKYQILTDNFSPVEYLTAEVYQSIN